MHEIQMIVIFWLAIFINRGMRLIKRDIGDVEGTRKYIILRGLHTTVAMVLILIRETELREERLRGCGEKLSWQVLWLIVGRD